MAIDAALALAVLVCGGTALVSRRRGGRLRELPGWALFWTAFAAILIALGRLPRWISFPALAVLMFAALRTYFFVAPVRRSDRYAILAAYLSIPFALWPAYLGSKDMFLAMVPVTLFLLVPVFLSTGAEDEGLLDAMGRTLLGVLLFVFCLAHLGLLVHRPSNGLPQLFGVLVLAAELPQRVFGRRQTLALVLSGLASTAVGWIVGPWVGLSSGDAARAGALVFLAVSLGALVAGTVARTLSADVPAARLGRGGLLNRMVPAVYAAPVFFHYLNYFAR
jgi:phosphatidate cytidylyltransferase